MFSPREQLEQTGLKWLIFAFGVCGIELWRTGARREFTDAIVCVLGATRLGLGCEVCERFAKIDASVVGRRRDFAVGLCRSQRTCTYRQWLLCGTFCVRRCSKVSLCAGATRDGERVLKGRFVGDKLNDDNVICRRQARLCLTMVIRWVVTR